MAKQKYCLLFITLVLALMHIPTTVQKVNPSGININQVFVNSVENVHGKNEGSIEGGTLVKIGCTGHNDQPSQNKVNIGPYPCIIEENGVTAKSIKCRTTPAFDPLRRSGLVVEVHPVGKEQSKCDGPCKFDFKDWTTPMIQFIAPSVATPNSDVNFYGIWKVRSFENILKLIIGDNNCDRFEENKQGEQPLNLNDQTELSYNSNTNVNCRVAPISKAGFYNAKIESTIGNPYWLAQSYMLTADGKQKYQFVVQSEITSISSNSGGVNGNELTIIGKGFETDIDKVQVEVAGNACTVTSIEQISDYEQQIKCNLGAAALSAGSASQYLQGQGVRYTKFDLDSKSKNPSFSDIPDTGSFASFISRLDAGELNGRKQEDRIMSSWESQKQPTDSASRSGMWARGFFKAPRTGTYKFYMSANSYGKVFLNTTPNTETRGAEILYKCGYTYVRSYSYPYECGWRQETGQTLNAGEYYWLEAFAYDRDNSIHFAVSVETPEVPHDDSNPIWYNALDEIFEYEVDYNHKPQVHLLEIGGDVDAKHILSFEKQLPDRSYFLKNRRTTGRTWKEWASNPDRLRQNLDSASSWFSVETIHLKYKAAAGGFCDDSDTDCKDSATGFEYKFQFNRYRFDNYDNEGKCINKGDCKFTQLEDQGDPLGGFYKLTWNNQPLKVYLSGKWVDEIPYNTQCHVIKRGIIETDINSQQWDIESYQHNRSQDGFRCRFFMRTKRQNLKGPWLKLQSDDSGLTGGLTKPTIKLTEPDIEKGGNKPFHEPVPFDMSFLKSSSPSVTVTVNGIPSVCNDSTHQCGYTTSESNTVDIASFALAGFQLTVTLSDASPFTLTPATTKITYGGAECPSVTISGNDLTCTLPGIEAGDHTPKVLFGEYGYGRLTGTSVNTQETTISITDFNAKTSNTNGGIDVTIDGTGFPISSTEGLTVTFGSAQATVKSTSNTQIVVVAPEQNAEGSVDLTVNYNSKSNTSGTQFSYNNASAHTISSLEFTTASPVKKQQLVVTGSNFVDVTYTNKDSFTAWLEKDGKKVYQLNVLAATSTTVTVMLGGGKTGTYQLVIYKGPLGKNINAPATANNFIYEIKLNGVSPQTGSSLGGTDITLTGTNFLNSVNSNTVFLNNGNTNLQCTTLEVINATTLKIRTPALPEGESIGPYKVIVQGKLQSESICPTPANCEFTYSSSNLPTLEEVTETHFKKDQKVTLTGTNWNGGVIKVSVNGVDYTATNINATTSEFTVPELLVGQYTFSVRIDGLSTLGSFSGRYVFAASDYSPKRPISANGDIITINGNGFNENISVKTGDVECKILERTPSQLKCQTKPGQTGKVHLNVSQLPDSPAQFKNAVNFSAATSSPKITANTPASADNRIQVPSNQQWSYQFTLSGVSTSDVVTAYLQGINSVANKNEGTVSGGTNSEYTVAFTGVQAGIYRLHVHIEGIGFAVQNDLSIISIVEFYLSNVKTTGPVSTGLAGGAQLTLSGVGFNDQDVTQNQVSVCGKQCPITSVTSSQIQCTLPVIETDYMKSKTATGQATLLFSVQEDDGKLHLKGSGGQIIENISGTLVKTDTSCEQEFTISGDQYAIISQVVFTSFSSQVYDYKLFLDVWNSETNQYIVEDVASESNSEDLVFFKKIALSNALNPFDTPVKSGVYTQKMRLRQQLSEGDVCLSNYGVIGTFFQKVEITTAQTFNCGVSVTVNGETQQSVNDQSGSSAASITYQQHTSQVDTIVPGYISSLGGETIKLRGSGFGTNPSAIKVFYDNIEQTVASVTDTLVTVTTVARTSSADNSGLRIVVNGNHSIITSTATLYQGLKYSDDVNTWGGELPPGEGDTIYVGPNQTLIVDQSTEKLYSVIVEGTLVFQDSQDSTGDGSLDLNTEPLKFDAELILIKGGNLIIGTEGNRYQRKLTITLHGNYFGKQLPEFGNKVLGCHTCNLNIHGQYLEHTWTHLTATAAVGATTLQTHHTTNWKVGDLLGIATTDYHGTHSEEATITAISGQTITIDKALKYEHLGVSVSYSKDGSNKDYIMAAEVANLSRNILIQGNPEDDRSEQYGGHLKVHGSSDNGSQVRLTYAEFRNTGQPRIVGRYTVHFHMIGNAMNSLVEGIAVHHAYARVIALHQVNYLKVRKNVGYMVGGHNIFLEDGVETYNTVEFNCIISPRSVFNMLQTDITVAGIWITNPSNFVRFNAVAGSQFYGLWYEIKERPESGSDKCPIGMEVFEVAHNIGHSNERFGLRFFNLQPRQKPCSPVRDDEKHHPFEDNPSIQYTYRNQTSWKNGESGILAEFMGNSIFEDCFLADNVRTGFQTHTTNFTAEPVIFRNSVVVGYTGQGVDVIQVPEMKQSAVLLSRTDGQITSNIDIHNFRANTHILESSSENQNIKLWTQSGYQNIVEKLRLHNSATANKLFWQGPRTNYIYDKDGSLAGSGGSPRWYTPHYDHIAAADECVRQSGADWDDTDICSRTVRGFKFAAFQDKDLFNAQKLKMLNTLKQDDSKVLTEDEDDITYFGMYLEQKIKNTPKDCEGCYANMYVTGYPYSFHWNYGIDFDHVIFFPNTYFEAGDESTVIKFPYKAQREVFDVKQMSAKQIVGQFQEVVSLSSLINADGSVNTSCQHGQNFNDAENKVFYVCVNGNKKDVDKYPIQQLDLTGVYCRDTCPVSGLVCDKESKVRNWKLPTEQDNAAQYLCDDCPGIVLVDGVQTKAIPQDGDDIVIPCKWTVTLNVPVLTVNNLYIDGTLRIPDNDPSQPETKIIAQNIWIRGGQIVAGQKDLPFQGKFTIELQGNSNSDALIIDDLSRTGTKSLAITAQLNLYGKFPITTQTQLQSTINAGDSSIQVSGDITDWQTDDELVLSASHVSGGGYEKVTIASVSGQTVTLKEPVKNWHYGNPQITIAEADAEKIIGDQYDGVELDMRTQVGHITRNIKIVGNESDIGGHIQLYHYLLEEDQTKGIPKVEARGSAILQGVQMINMGQTGSLNAGLHFTYTNLPSNDDNKHLYRDTVVTKSSIVDCPGYCVNGFQAHDVNLSENIIYNAEKYGLQALEVKNWTVTKNLIIGVKKRPQVGEVDTALWDPVFGIHMYEPYDPNTDTFDVSYNKISGVEGVGIGIPGTPCALKNKIQFKYNSASYCSFDGALFNNLLDECYFNGYFSAFHNTEGATINNNKSAKGYEISHMVYAENLMNLKLHSGSNSVEGNNYKAEKIWLSPYVRTSCTDCYDSTRLGTNSYCSSTNGIRLHVTTEGGEKFPWKKNPFSYDVICVPPNAFGQVFLENIEFDNYKETYGEGILCGGNRAFRNHPSGADAQAGHYLREVTCNDCDQDGKVFLMEPKEKWRGWFGGCGQFDCTGQENVIIQDLTGHFIGTASSPTPGTIISNNELIGDKLDECSYVPAWNSFSCSTLDLGILQWDAIGEDKQELSPVPVMVTNDDWSNKVNMWREWEWQGPEPLNKRLNRFVSLISANQWHNITYAGTKSVDIVHKLQTRQEQGEPDRYVIVKYMYGNSLALEVLVNGDIVKPYLFENPPNLEDKVSTCGGNNYYHKNNTIHFIVTNAFDCIVQVRQVNQVFVNMRLKMTVEEFYADVSKQTEFIDRMAAFLEIDFSKIRIVGATPGRRRRRILAEGDEESTNSGEINVEIQITGSVPGRQSQGYKPQADYKALTELADKLKKGADGGELTTEGGYEVAGAEYEVIVIKEAGLEGDKAEDLFDESDLAGENKQQQTPSEAKNKVSEEEKGKMIAIALGILFGIIGIILIAMIVYHFWKKRQITQVRNQEIPQNEGDDKIHNLNMQQIGQMHASSSHNLSQNNRMIMEEKHEPSQIQQDQVSNNVENIESQSNQNQEQ